MYNPTFTGFSRTLPWLALTVKARHEQVVREALEMRGFEGYAPTCKVVRRWSDRFQKVETPLFAGYVFCRGITGSRTPILRIPGVRSVVSFGGEAARVPDAEIEHIRCVLASGFTVEPWPFLTVGTLVRIHAGPLAGVEGIVVEDRDNWRVVVSVQMLQRSVAVHVTRDALSPARVRSRLSFLPAQRGPYVS
jgi:transcription antitermination factor NusG